MRNIVPEKWIQTKVTIGFIIIIAIALLIFTISYFSVVSIIKVQNKEFTHEEEFTYLNQLIFEIIETEGLSRVYGVTGNVDYKEQYEVHHDSVLSVIHYLPLLFTDTTFCDEIDEIERLYQQKKELTDILMNINIQKLHFPSTKNLLASIPDSLNYKITQYTITNLKVDTSLHNNATIDSTLSQQEEKTGFFKRFFGGKKKQDENTNKEPIISMQVDSTVMEEVRPDDNMEEIKTKIIKAGNKEKRLNIRVQEHENELIELDRLLTDEIKDIITNLHEATIKRNIKKRNELAFLQADMIDRILILVGSAIFLMLFFIFWISRDIAKSLRLKNAVIKAKEKVDKLLKVKEQFVAHMSHEIRTPLTSIIGFSEQLAEKELPKAENDILTRIRLSAEHLKGLVNNVLDFSMLESGNIDFYKDQVDANKLMEEVEHLFYLKAQESQIALTYDIDENIDYFESDALRLKQVLINLIGNALKFTHTGSVHYTVELKKDKLIFTVKDTGIGIPKDKQKSVFEMFNQVNISLSRKYSGTGLGLSISRQIIEAMGGHIQLQSKVTEGSTFTFDIPYIKGKALPKTISQKTPFHYFDKNILAIDDDEMICQVLDGILHDKCKRLDVNSSSELALNAIGQVDYDLFLIDLHMPKLDGLQLMHIIREERKIATPILFLTADMVNAELKNAKDNDSIWVMPKPFTQDMILTKIAEMLNIAQKNEIEIQPTMKKQSHTNQPANYSLEDVISFTGDDKIFLQSIIQSFIKNTDSGIEDIKEAIAHNTPNYEIIGERAHKLLTGFRQFKITTGIVILSELEKSRTSQIDTKELHGNITHLTNLWIPIKDELNTLN